MKVKDEPPADLLKCAHRAAVNPPGQVGALPRPIRDWLNDVAAASGANSDQLDQLVNWLRPGSCGE